MYALGGQVLILVSCVVEKDLVVNANQIVQIYPAYKSGP